MEHRDDDDIVKASLDLEYASERLRDELGVVLTIMTCNQVDRSKWRNALKMYQFISDHLKMIPMYKSYLLMSRTMKLNITLTAELKHNETNYKLT